MYASRTPVHVRLAVVAVVAALATPCTAAAAESEAEKPGRGSGVIEVKQSKALGHYLFVSLPREPKGTDRLVVIYCSPAAGAKPRDLLLMPAGSVEKAAARVTEAARELDIEVHMFSEFSNGRFDVVSGENSRDQRGVYAVTEVSKTDSRTYLGSCTTYFTPAEWRVEQDGPLEVPIPGRAPAARDEPVPTNCVLHVFLVSPDGTELARGRVNVKRK